MSKSRITLLLSFALSFVPAVPAQLGAALAGAVGAEGLSHELASVSNAEAAMILIGTKVKKNPKNNNRYKISVIVNDPTGEVHAIGARFEKVPATGPAPVPAELTLKLMGTQKKTREFGSDELRFERGDAVGASFILRLQPLDINGKAAGEAVLQRVTVEGPSDDVKVGPKETVDGVKASAGEAVLIEGTVRGDIVADEALVLLAPGSVVTDRVRLDRGELRADGALVDGNLAV